MANTFTWDIRQLDTIPNFNGYTNFVTRVHWTYIATDENGISANLVGYFEFNNAPSDYVDYSNLTREEVVAWCEIYTSTTELQDILNKKISDIVNPPIVNLPLPWVPEPVQEVVPDVPSEPSQDPVV
jgi:hypothetical protein